MCSIWTSTLSVTGDYWDADRTGYSTLGLDFTSNVWDDFRGSLGTFFSKYKIDTTTFEEREDVRTYYIRIDYDLSRNWAFDINYQFEDTSIAGFHVLRMDLKWRF